MTVRTRVTHGKLKGVAVHYHGSRVADDALKPALRVPDGMLVARIVRHLDTALVQLDELIECAFRDGLQYRHGTRPPGTVW